MNQRSSRLAVVTGASAGIGYELALRCAADGFDLLIAADEPEIDQAASRLRENGVAVTATPVSRSLLAA